MSSTGGGGREKRHGKLFHDASRSLVAEIEIATTASDRRSINGAWVTPRLWLSSTVLFSNHHHLSRPSIVRLTAELGTRRIFIYV